MLYDALERCFDLQLHPFSFTLGYTWLNFPELVAPVVLIHHPSPNIFFFFPLPRPPRTLAERQLAGTVLPRSKRGHPFCLDVCLFLLNRHLLFVFCAARIRVRAHTPSRTHTATSLPSSPPHTSQTQAYKISHTSTRAYARTHTHSCDSHSLRRYAWLADCNGGTGAGHTGGIRAGALHGTAVGPDKLRPGNPPDNGRSAGG